MKEKIDISAYDEKIKKALIKKALGYDFEEVKVDKILKFKSCAIENTIAKTKDGIIFVIGGEVYELKDKSLSKNFTMPKDVSPSKDKATIDGKYYFLSVNNNGVKMLCILDLEDYSYQLLNLKDLPFTLADDDGNEFYYKSTGLDFGESKEKVLSTIYVKTDAKVKVTVSGDGGVASFVADEKSSGLITGIRSKTFSFTLSGEGEPVKIDQIKFYFKD